MKIKISTFVNDKHLEAITAGSICIILTYGMMGFRERQVGRESLNWDECDT